MPKFKKTNFTKTVSANTQKQKNAESSYGYLRLPKNIQMFNIDKEGKYEIDFIPYIVSINNHPDKDGDIAAKDTLWYRMPFKVHKNVGDDNDSVICPTTFGLKCPICEYKKKRAAEGADKEELKALNPSRRALYAVIPKQFDKTKINKEEAVMLFDYSEFLFQKLLNDEIAEDESFAAFPDLEEGLTLRIRFEEEQFMKNKFYSASRIDFIERDAPYPEDILDEVPALESLLVVLPYKEIEAKFMGVEPEDIATDDDVVEEQPTRRRKAVEPDPDPAPVRRRSTPTPPPAPEPDEDTEPEYDADEIPEEERCVACKGTGKNSRGATCPICGGTGRKPAPPRRSVTVDKTVEDYKPRATRTTTTETPPATRSRKPAEPDNKCPHGHAFGADCDKHKDCEMCTSWDECSEA